MKMRQKSKIFSIITYKILHLIPFRGYFHILKKRVYKQEALLYYTKNAERVNAIANMLADEYSKESYLGMIKFRQTYDKKKYPITSDEYQYFIKEFKFNKNEVFLDCGAFIGDTIDIFLKHCPYYDRIVAFEPDSKNFEKLKIKHSDNQKITLINAGAYNKNGEVSFLEHGNGDSAIIETLGIKSNYAKNIQVKSIDSLNLKNVSFIKMDIEGAELNALKGAEKTIIKNKPKLAICIYHSDEDMIRIAEYIHELVPEYKLYVRHYSFYPITNEIVLYALP
jgi:FkbM family methyltransferase